MVMTAGNQTPSTRALAEDAAETPGVPRKCAILGISLAVVFLVAVLDYFTGVQIRVFPLYYLPIAFGTYYLSSKAGFFLGVSSTIGWLASNWLFSEDYFDSRVWIINTATMMISFLTISFLIARLKRGFDRERSLSRADQLTGLPNSRAFYEHAELLIAGARRSGRPFVIAYFDLDNFKIVNDERGHQTGDLVLKEVGRILREGLRASDVVARIGGDEFVAILPDTGAQDASVSLERIRTKLVEEMGARRWPVTVSIGAATFALAPATLDEALRFADDVMYEAKDSGKNRVHVRTVAALGCKTISKCM
jgi:diguanylate cyclase (GGDEF)-like protein